MEGEHDPKCSQQAQRVPVGHRVAQALVGDVRSRMPHAGEQTRNQTRDAHDRHTEHQAPHQPAQVVRTRLHRPEQDEHKQVKPGTVELDQGSTHRVRPDPRSQCQRRVTGECSYRHKRGRRETFEGMARLHDSYEQDLRQHERRHRRGTGKVPTGVEPEEYDQPTGQQHQADEPKLAQRNDRRILRTARVSSNRYAIGHRRIVVAAPEGWTSV